MIPQQFQIQFFYAKIQTNVSENFKNLIDKNIKIKMVQNGQVNKVIMTAATIYPKIQTNVGETIKNLLDKDIKIKMVYNS